MQTTALQKKHLRENIGLDSVSWEGLDSDLIAIAALTGDGILTRVGDGVWELVEGGSILSVAGTANRITVTGTTDPIIDISSVYDAMVGKVINPLSQFAPTTSAQLAGIISDETGSGSLVFATSPTLVTPTLGVASATTINKVTLTQPATGSTLTIVDGSVLTVSASATITNGTHSGTNTGDQTNITGNAATVTTNANLTGHITSTGNATILGSFTSAQLLAALSDETGTGVAVFATSPTLITPIIGASGPRLKSTSGKIDVRNNADSDYAGTNTQSVHIFPETIIYGATMAVDAALSNKKKITLAGNGTISNPTNSVDGAILVFILRQDGTGSRVPVWDTNYRFRGDLATVTLSTGAGIIDRVGFEYVEADVKWDCISLNLGG